MKLLEPTITCLLMSHMKPTLREALESVLTQTRLADVQVLVLDSGQWLLPELRATYDLASREGTMQTIYDDYAHLPTIEWYCTGEPANARERYCPVSHWTNVAIRQGLIRGTYLCFLFDDDLLAPTFMERMAGYLDAHQGSMAVHCTQRRIEMHRDGRQVETSPLLARPRSGQTFDCHVDGGQVMLRTAVLGRMDDPWFPEDPGISCSHSDGLFLNKLGAVIPQMDAIDEPLSTHRNTIYSTYTPTP